MKGLESLNQLFLICFFTVLPVAKASSSMKNQDSKYSENTVALLFLQISNLSLLINLVIKLLAMPVYAPSQQLSKPLYLLQQKFVIHLVNATDNFYAAPFASS